MSQELPPSMQKVQDAIAAAGQTVEVRVLTGSTRTAREAADALGCDVGAIASSLIFIADGKPLLVMTSGAHRVDVDFLAVQLGKGEIVRATADQVRAATGQVIGGVAPVGHPAPIETVVDEMLREHKQIWAAAGTPHSLFSTTYPALLKLTSGTPTPVVPR